MPTLVWQLLLQIILIALNAVFACAEIAVISINDAGLAKLAAGGDKRAQRLVKLTNQPAKFLATIQVAITLAGFLGSAFAADNFSEMLVRLLEKTNIAISSTALDTICVIVITLVLSYFTLVFGELVPKRIAMKRAEKIALGMSGFITFISKAFAPLVWLLTVSTNGVLRLCGVDPNAEEQSVTEEEIRMMIDVGAENGAIDDSESEMIKNVFEFDDVSAGEIATHRTLVDFLWSEDDDTAWSATIDRTRHSHYPVCADSADRVVGVLDAKDYFRLKDHRRETVLAYAMEEPYFVPESLKADVLFSSMKKRKNHFAIVLDEYGGVIGIITMNDLLEQIVGDLADSDDEQECICEKIDENTWRMSGSVPLDVITDELHVEFPQDEFETLGGLIFSTQTTVPQDGASFECTVCGLDISVKEIREHRVAEAIVSIPKKKAEEIEK